MDSRLFMLRVYIFVVCYGYSTCEARILVTCPRRNMYIQIRDDGSQKCAPCSPCPKGTQKKRCSLWHNSECETCPDGYYNRRFGSRCKPCTVCQPGEYILRRCSPDGDAVCSPCPNRTFSSTTNAFRCTPCTYCRPHEELVHTCNSTSDYNCGRCKQEYFRESASGSCLPCSKCFAETFVVQECFDKNFGHSDKVCMPTNRIRRVFITEELPTMQPPIENKDIRFYPLLLWFLVLIPCCTITIVIVLVYRRRYQSTIRHTRDTVGNGTPSETWLMLDHMKVDTLYGLFQKSLQLIKGFLIKRKGFYGDSLNDGENVCLDNRKEAF